MFIKKGKLRFNKKQTSLKTAYYILSKDPIIIITAWSFWDHTGKIFSENFKSKKVYFIFLIWWSLESEFMVKGIKNTLREHKKRYPKHNVIFLCNSEGEYKIFRKFNLPCLFCNHNALIDEKIFTIIPKEKKRYNAVYNAQMAWFKRHYLASKIEKLALITYFDGVKSSDLYCNIIKKVLSDAIWMNKPSLNSKNRHLSPVEVSRYLNRARVGLCLSAKEGTMYASTEYLLCGLPVVSTRSIGGRDVFFDKEYVKIVNKDRASVKEGVDELIEQKISPNNIRMKTLKIIGLHRKRFIDLVQQIYDKEGINKNFQNEWKKVFIDKMWKWQDMNLIKKYI